MFAAGKGHGRIVQLILDSGATKVNAANDCGETALMRAADEGHADVAGRLLQHPDIDVNARDVSGMTALSYARAESIEERVRNLRVQRGGAKEAAKSEIVAMLRLHNAR